jgi:CHAD domain-containing protein
MSILLPIKAANLLRSRLRHLLELHDLFALAPDEKTVHDLRVSSRRLREVLEYLEPGLPAKWHARCLNLAKQITKALGSLRENEVNIALLKQLNEQRKIAPLTAEILIHTQSREYRKKDEQAREKLSHKKFGQCEKFLTKIRGSRSLPPSDEAVLRKRQMEFLSFSWDEPIDDERLHDLRIRTKKFRYSYEIYDRLHNRNLGRFLRQIKYLQDILGLLHDYYVLGNLIRVEKEKWSQPSVLMIPTALEEAADNVERQKCKLIPEIYPKYARVVEKLPSLLQISPSQVA